VSQIAVGGLHWNVDVTGAGPHVLLLHGFTGSLATWASHREAWRGFTTIAVDLPGHGDSDRLPETSRDGFTAAVTGLVGVLDTLGVERTAVLGYSMGGRLALHLAVHLAERRSARLTALVIESASPGIANADERRARLESDMALAASIERDGVAAFTDRWEALPLFATQRRLSAGARDAVRRQRLANDASGLASALRHLSVGGQDALLARLATIDVPTLLVAGALDAAYCRHAESMAAALPRSRVAIMADAGHAVHLEQPTVFASTVRDFLDACMDEDSTETEQKETRSCP
jgi:2-succinyl-6-hydroxy-2,4-cyclohexadiene-1-carboxylate synthase